MLSVKQVADRLNVKKSTIYEAIAQGLLRCFRIKSKPNTRGAIRISEEQLQEYLAASMQAVSLPAALVHIQPPS